MPLHRTHGSRIPLASWALALLLVLSTAVRADEPPVAGTLPEDYLPGLKDLLATALKQSPQMISNAILIAVAEADRISGGISPMLPSVGGGVNYGYTSQGNSGASNSHSSGLYYNVGISQPLFQWGVLKNHLKLQNIARSIAEKNYAAAYVAFAGTLRSQYLSLIVTKINLRNARYSLSQSQKALTDVKEKVKTGAAGSSAVIGPEMDTQEQEISVERLTQAYEFARHKLAREAGLTDLPDESIPVEIPAPKYVPEASSALLAAFLRDGGSKTLQEQVEELNIRKYDLNYQIVKTGLLPKFSAGASYGLQNYTTASTTSVSQTALTTLGYSIGASWTLFDGFATHEAKRSALLSKRYYEAQVKMNRENLMDNAQKSQRAIDFAWRELALADRRHALAASGLQLTQDEFKLGNSTPDSVASATGQLNANDSSLASARADFLSSWSDFVSLVGEDPVMNNLPARYVR